MTSLRSYVVWGVLISTAHLTFAQSAQTPPADTPHLAGYTSQPSKTERDWAPMTRPPAKLVPPFINFAKLKNGVEAIKKSAATLSVGVCQMADWRNRLAGPDGYSSGRRADADSENVFDRDRLTGAPVV